MEENTEAPEYEGKRSYAFLKGEIERGKKFLKGWNRKRVELYKRYAAERDVAVANGNLDALLGDPKFAIFWSNVNTLAPAYYSSTLNPVVYRRYSDKDPVARDASELAERALKYNSQSEYFDGPFLEAVKDLLIAARGCLWIDYDPVLEGEEQIKFEDVKLSHVFGGDLLYSPARRELDLKWVARRWFKTRTECIEAWGDKVGKKIPLTRKPKDDEEEKNSNEDEKINESQAVGWEIWFKEQPERYYIADGFEGILQVDADPIGIGENLPCVFLWGTLPEDKLLPVADLTFYKRQADRLEDITKRCDNLVDAIRVSGAYNAAVDGLGGILSKGSGNKLIPVKDWAGFTQGGGIEGGIQFVPIKEVVEALSILQSQKEPLKQEIYEITGIADIIRGATKASETATAQQIKGQWAGLRLDERRKQIAEAGKKALILMAKVIFKKFQPETIQTITSANEVFIDPLPVIDPLTGQPQLDSETQQPIIQPQFNIQRFQSALALLQDDISRQFRIDIETDATYAFDREQQRAENNEFLGAVSDFFQRAMPMVQQMPEMATFATELLSKIVRSHKGGRNLEASIEKSLEQYMANLGQETPEQQAEKERQAQEQARFEAERAEKERELLIKERELDIRQQELDIEQAKIEHEKMMKEEDHKLKKSELESRGVNTSTLKAKKIKFQEMPDGSEVAIILGNDEFGRQQERLIKMGDEEMEILDGIV